MKRILIGIFLFLILIPFVSSLEVKRVMPSSAAPGELVDVVLNIDGARVGKIFTLQDKITPAINIEEWAVEGAKEIKENIDYKAERNGWSFTADSAVLKISYKIKIPASVLQNYEFEATWFSPDGNGYEKTVLDVTASGEVAQSAQDTQVIEDTQQDSSENVETSLVTGAIVGENNKGKSSKWWFIIPAAIAAIVLLLTIVSKAANVYPKNRNIRSVIKKPEPMRIMVKEPEPQKPKIEEYKKNMIRYVKEALNKGRTEQEVEYSLINAGWSPDMIKRVVHVVAERSREFAKEIRVRSQVLVNKSLKYHKKAIKYFENGNTKKSELFDKKAKELREKGTRP